jgi:hypothetical protein
MIKRELYIDLEEEMSIDDEYDKFAMPPRTLNAAETEGRGA